MLFSQCHNNKYIWGWEKYKNRLWPKLHPGTAENPQLSPVGERERECFEKKCSFCKEEEFFSNKWWQHLENQLVPKQTSSSSTENCKFIKLIENSFPQISLFTQRESEVAMIDPKFVKQKAIFTENPKSWIRMQKCDPILTKKGQPYSNWCK